MTDNACGDWHFQFQAGYLPDEGRALAFLLVRNGSAAWSTFGARALTAMLMVEGLRHAPEFTRAGLRTGLETLRELPAATGGAGSYMGFSARDRLALKGPRLLLFKRITPEGFELVAA